MNALYLGGYGFVAARSGFRPLVVSSLGSDLLVDYPSSLVHRLQIRSVLRQADLVLTDAEELSRIAISIGASPGKILKAYLGIDESIFFPRKSAPDETRPGGGARVVSTRNLYPVYNVDLLVDAAPLIREKRDAHFVVCGDGPERARLEEKVKRLSLEGSFVFKGRLDPAGNRAGAPRRGRVRVDVEIGFDVRLAPRGDGLRSGAGRDRSSREPRMDTGRRERPHREERRPRLPRRRRRRDPR